MYVTNISLLLLVLFDALQLAAGATGLFSQGVTAVVHGCSIHALGPRVNPYTVGGMLAQLHLCQSHNALP